ncbi:MAG: hypothetical protein ACUVRH_01990 [Candidatus Bipolaricaulia bacterium]
MGWKVVLLPILVFALSAASFQAGWARSIDELIDLAGRDSLPEVRAAAGLALGKLLIDSPLTNSELESMAMVGRSSELRGAAGAALRERLLLAGLGLEELEALASGPTPELRSAAIPALVQATVAAVGRGELSLAKLARAIAEGATHELRLARAEALFLLLRAELVAPGAQGLVEAVLRGERVTVRGVELNGEILEVRAAASELLAGIYKFYGLLDRLREPLAELLAVATDLSLTAEFRAAAGEALEFIFLAERGRALAALQELEALLDELLEEAQGQPAQAGQTLAALQGLFERERANLIHTAEVGGEFTAAQRLENVARNLERMRTALATFDLPGLSGAISAVERDLQVIEKGVTRAPDIPLESLMEWAAFGGTPELRRAAGAALGKRLLWANLSYDELLELVISGPSEELRSGAGAALTVKLIEKGLSELELLRMIARYTWAFGPRAGTSKELGEALSRALAQLWLG